MMPSTRRPRSRSRQPRNALRARSQSQSTTTLPRPGGEELPPPYTTPSSNYSPGTRSKTSPSPLVGKSKRVRTGCLTCRERHLKCDEGAPDCNNCRKSNRECKRGIRLNFIDIQVKDPPCLPPTAEWSCSLLSFDALTGLAYTDKCKEALTSPSSNPGRVAVYCFRVPRGSWPVPQGCPLAPRSPDNQLPARDQQWRCTGTPRCPSPQRRRAASAPWAARQRAPGKQWPPIPGYSACAGAPIELGRVWRR